MQIRRSHFTLLAGACAAAVSLTWIHEGADRLIAEGRHTFRYDTFGDEAFWSDSLHLHEAIAGAAHGGVGPGVSPRTALALGLKVDTEQLDHQTRRAIARGQVDLDDPAVTLALLQQDAVVGVSGTFGRGGRLVSVGITCALCHSMVDDSLTAGMGERRDGWPNRDLDVGSIIAVAPDLSPFQQLLGVDRATVETVLHSWGPGKFDAHLLLDGRAFRPDGGSAAVVIPAAFGLAGVNYATYEGWGGISHWNALVATLEMGGRGTLIDSRLRDTSRFPIAAANGFAEIRRTPDQVTSKLAALQVYQLSLSVPQPPPGSFEPAAARRGRNLFNGRAGCASCHVPGLFTEPGYNLHDPADIGIDDFQARRGPNDRYRTTPLRGLFTKQHGGYYHDGRFATLLDVIDHYDAHLHLGLQSAEKADLAAYLQSL